MTTPYLTDKAALLIAAARSQFGHVAVAVAGEVVAGVSIGHRSDAAAARQLTRLLDDITALTTTQSEVDEAFAVETLDRLVASLDGEPIDLSDIPVSLIHLSAFQRRVVAACQAIPCGATQTYGQLAEAAGSPGAARAVGQVMATNRYPLIVPCHRVVAAGGRLGGFSAPQGTVLKRQLLAFEAAIADNEHVLVRSRHACG